MKILAVVLAASLVSLAASAQPPAGMPGGPGPNGPGGAPAPAPERTYITAAEIADMIGQADAAAKAGTQYRGAPLLNSGPFRGGMEYDTKSPSAPSYAVHDDNDELFIVIDGSGTMTMGGTLVNPTHRGANQSSPTVDGAKQYPLAKGNMILVPAGTPHAVTGVDGGKLVMMTMHMPVPAATTAPAAGAPQAPPPAR